MTVSAAWSIFVCGMDTIQQRHAGQLPDINLSATSHLSIDSTEVRLRGRLRQRSYQMRGVSGQDAGEELHHQVHEQRPWHLLQEQGSCLCGLQGWRLSADRRSGQGVCGEDGHQTRSIARLFRLLISRGWTSKQVTRSRGSYSLRSLLLLFTWHSLLASLYEIDGTEQLGDDVPVANHKRCWSLSELVVDFCIVV
jgi:hypothetical protein